MDLPGTLPDRREWSWQESGFWAPGPHLVLEERRNHPDRGVIARRVVVLEAAAAAPRAYFLRDYYFSEAGLRAELASAGCASAETAADVVVQEDFVQAAPWFVCAG
jgi:hypothetical protein